MKHKRVTQASFAQTLGVDKKLIAYHVRKGNAPKLGDVAAWTEFLTLAGRDGSMPKDQRVQMAAARLRIAKATAAKLERENQIKKGEVVEWSEVARLAADAEAFYWGGIDRMSRELPAQLVGLTAIQAKAVLTRAFREHAAASRAKFEAIKGKEKKS